MSRITTKAWYKKIVNQLAIKYEKDPRVIEYIAHYPFSFLKNVITDEKNNRAVRFKHLGVFFLRHSDLKNIVYNRRIEVLLEGVERLVESGIFKSKEEAIKEIKTMSRSNINRFYKSNVALVKQI